MRRPIKETFEKIYEPQIAAANRGLGGAELQKMLWNSRTIFYMGFNAAIEVVGSGDVSQTMFQNDMALFNAESEAQRHLHDSEETYFVDNHEQRGPML